MKGSQYLDASDHVIVLTVRVRRIWCADFRRRLLIRDVLLYLLFKYKMVCVTCGLSGKTKLVPGGIIKYVRKMGLCNDKTQKIWILTNGEKQ